MPKVEKNEKNMKRCVCPDCPTYNDCAKEKMEGLFCAQAVGKGACEYEKHGCICTQCPLTLDSKLTSVYYCTEGSAEEIDD